jgi:hypothetical protein
MIEESLKLSVVVVVVVARDHRCDSRFDGGVEEGRSQKQERGSGRMEER